MMKIKTKIKKFHAELSNACGHQDTQLVRTLLETGENLQEPWTVDDYPVAIAVQSNNLELLAMLLEAGMPAYINTKLAIKRYGESHQGSLAFLWEPSCHQAIMYLLDNGASVNSDSGENPPAWALAGLHDSKAGTESEEFFERLVAGGVDVDAPWGEQQKLLHLISQGKNRYVPRLIALSKNVNVTGIEKFDTPLKAAVIAGSDLAVKALLERGAIAKAYAWKGKILLELAEHMKDYKKHLNLKGELDRICALLSSSSQAE